MPAEPRDAAAASPVLRADGLGKRFGDRTALADVTFELDRGRAFGLLGPNGAGKTTTVRLLTGLLAPSEGSVSLFGERLDRTDADALRARIGVQTDTNLSERLTVRENLRVWGELFGMPRRRIDPRIDELLELLELADRADSAVGELSKGMRQKAAVARAVLHGPELLFLDEPTAGLDPEAAAELIDELRRLIRTTSTTIVLCTHQLHGLESLCDELGILVGGRLVAAGEVSTLLRERWPRHRFRLESAGDPAVATGILDRMLASPVPVAGALEFSVDEEAEVPGLVAALVAAAVPVHAVVPLRPTIDDFYFATLAEAERARGTAARPAAIRTAAA